MTRWERSLVALQVLATDPKGLGGIALRARSGPVRDRFLEKANKLFPVITKLHPNLQVADLFGGLDLAGTLSAGTVVKHAGLLSRDNDALVLPMAERCPPQLSALLGAAMDDAQTAPLIAFDEGAEPEERLPAALSERLAIQLDLSDLSMADLSEVDPPVPQKARAVDLPDTLPEELIQICASLGIHSLRAPSFALRFARSHAALFGRNRVESEDIEAAISVILAPRATQLPMEQEQQSPEPQSDSPADRQEQEVSIPQDILLEAVKAALPPDLLASLSKGALTQTTGSGSGGTKTGNRRGRPLPARGKRARTDEKIDLMATLRAAVPWQSLRKTDRKKRTGAIIRPEDLRAKRYEEQSDRLLIFTVDASGSSAIARLAEAKGAVELLLADAYARRDHVALVAFRGDGAELLLPPTRSLVQTKRRLAELPGGGGTPTAAGLKSALDVAQHARRKGMTPTVILLTDGRSNISLEGKADRKQAASDSTEIARLIRRQGVEALVIDTGNRPEATLATLAHELSGRYIAMPRADAKGLSKAVSDELG